MLAPKAGGLSLVPEPACWKDRPSASDGHTHTMALWLPVLLLVVRVITMNHGTSSDLPVFSLIFRTSVRPWADESVPFHMSLSKLLKSQRVTSDILRAVRV